MENRANLGEIEFLAAKVKQRCHRPNTSNSSCSPNCDWLPLLSLVAQHALQLAARALVRARGLPH
jgi:hypothetical protein